MEGFQDDNAEFSAEEVENVASKAIQSVLNGAVYNNKKVNEWTNAIVTACLKDLQHLGRPFKYVISCIIMQNNGAGMVSSASMYWDTTKDGHIKSTFNNETINCIVTIFGASVNIEDQDLENM